MPSLTMLAQVHVGRGDDADVELHRSRFADALDLALLQRAQQLGLQRQRHRRHFVDEERAAMRQLEASGARRRLAPVNAPLTWPNSSASASVSGMAAALNATKRCSARGLLW